MDLKSTQLKDTYGNLLTIGTTAGSPTTGTLENGDGEDITALDVAGTITADGLTVDGTTVLDSETNFVADTSSANKSLVLASQGATGGDGTLGASVAFSRINTESPRAAIAAINTDSSFERMGLSFWTHQDNFENVMKKRMVIDHEGDISFYEDTGTTPKFFWDADAARLGIGTTSPDTTLHVFSGSSGGTVPSFTPFVVENNTNTIIQLLSPSANAQSINFGDADDSDVGQITYLHASNQMLFDVNAQEAMRINSSGDVLVGMTTYSASDDGHYLGANGSLFSQADDFYAGTFSRLTNDGDIVRFRKDSTVVGTIGVTASDNLYIGGSSTDHTGLVFPDNAILPAKELAATDNFVDLGSTTRRFKDLHLSGNVILSSGQGIDFSDTPNSSGTMTSELLDDYEEGTFTPEIADASTGGNVGSGSIAGQYIKIGDLVNIVIDATNIDTTGMTSGNDIYIRNLPFSPSAQSGLLRFTNAPFLRNITLSGEYVVATIADSLNYVSLEQINSNSNTSSIQVSDLTSGTADINFSLTYRTFN